MILNIILLLIGFILLIKGAEWLVNGSSALAKKYNISNITIGLTIVAFGTSAPELVVNSFASIQDHEEIVFSNIIGSNNFNLFIILGITGLISPLMVQSRTIYREIPISFFAIALLFVLSNDLLSGGTGVVTRMDAGLLLLMFFFFLYYVYFQLKRDPADEEIPTHNYSNLKITLLIIIGLAGLVLGGRMVVMNAIEMATQLGVSEKIIGLTIVAAGTSLPELTTSAIAAMKKKTDIAIGNIIGSNIFNIFLILSISGLIDPLYYNEIFNTDMMILGGGTVFLFLALAQSRKKILHRWQAAVLLVSYVSYTIYLISLE
ncbi:MAG: calcium/sodium antiporter [Flavisolibacter sp.]|jgi:cation:H+ antiporter|nr:calcium/sodium antiporter [Flavisolibacter sp.]